MRGVLRHWLQGNFCLSKDVLSNRIKKNLPTPKTKLYNIGVEFTIKSALLDK